MFLSIIRVLEILDISDNQLCGQWKTPDFAGFDALVAAVDEHALLTMDAVNMAEELNVSGQNIGVDGAKLMATFVENNGALRTLVFGAKQAVTMTSKYGKFDNRIRWSRQNTYKYKRYFKQLRRRFEYILRKNIRFWMV